MIANSVIVGRIKLGVVLTKGQLEIELHSAQDLRFDFDSSLGVYVKIYLKSNKSRTNKRKTKLVPPCSCPIFKQVIRYDGSQVDNKTLEVSVWQKLGGLKGKTPIGLTDIRLSELELGRLQTCWYRLHSMDIGLCSSIDD